VIKDNPAKKIEILVKMDRNKIYASVKDEGSGFIVEKIIKDEEARVAQTEPENPGGDTGRGLTLMRDYDISYEDNGSKIILTHPKKNFRIK
jgi:anti-sigma regulatory factor (Ser/Thr protein kinase)